MGKHVEEYVQDGFRTSDGMFSVAVDQKIMSWNATAEKLLGRRQDQVLGKKCYEIMLAIGGSGRIRCKRDCAVVTNAAKGRTTRDFDLECRPANGPSKRINMSILLVAGPTAKTGERRILHLFRDVTDRRKVEIAHAGNPVPNSQRPDDSVGERFSSGHRFPPLTTREDQVLKLLAAGKNTADISEILAIRPLTARNHVSRLLTKLGCRSRLEAVAVGIRAGLI